MAQWTNLQRIKKFVNGTRLYITCEKSGGLHLAAPGLTAGWLAGQPAKFGRGLKFYKFAVDQKILFFALFSQRTVLFQQLWCIYNAFSRQRFLQGCFIKCEILRSPMISYRSLLYICYRMCMIHCTRNIVIPTDWLYNAICPIQKNCTN